MGARITGTNPTLSANHTSSVTALPPDLDERTLRVIPCSPIDDLLPTPSIAETALMVRATAQESVAR